MLVDFVCIYYGVIDTKPIKKITAAPKEMFGGQISIWLSVEITDNESGM